MQYYRSRQSKMSTSYLKSPTSSSTSSFSSQEHIPLNPSTLSSTSTSSTLSIFCVARFIEQFTLEDPSTREKEAGWWCCWRLLLIFCCVYCPQKIVFVFCKRVVGVVNDLLVLLKNANDRSYVESDLVFSFSFIFFSPQMYFWAWFFSTWKCVNCGKNFVTKHRE